MPDKEAAANEFDRPWKVALEIYLRPFLQLCFPSVHELVDWQHPPEFLSTDLPSLVPNQSRGQLAVDKLVKVRLLDGRLEWLFIHVEVQSQRQSNFSLRMWTYYYRIRDKLGENVLSLAVLADDDPTWIPDTYESAMGGLELRFRFPTFKVVALRHPEEIFTRTGNPFALVIAAHQLALATLRDPNARLVRRAQLWTHLASSLPERRQLRELWRVISTLTRLPPDLELKFRELTTNVIRMSIDDLLSPLEEMAMEEGKATSRRQDIIDALEARFGATTSDLAPRLEPIKDLELLRQILRWAVTESSLERFLARLPA